MAADDFDTRVTESRTKGPEKLVHRLAALRVTAGPDAGKELRLGTGTAVIGTHSQCELVLSDRRVSSRHAEVALRPHGYLLRDLGSRNGTRAGSWRVERIYLTPGMQLLVGNTTLEVADLAQVEETALSSSQRLGQAVGRSLSMRALFAKLELVARSTSNLLLEGETGTGKSFLAEQVHLVGPRAGGPFEVFDCGAATPSLIEAQLFGHVKGAFTGAEADRPGALERADGGTLFLDEVGSLPLSLQPKLLRAIDSRRFSRLGESRARQVDARVVAATNVNLAHEVACRRFRQDLYFRFAVIRVTVPPLRERLDDLPLLIDALARPLLPAGESLSAGIHALLPLLASYDWPGNVRELRNVVERLIELPPLDALPTAIRPEGGMAADPAPRGYRDARNLALDEFERRYTVELLKLTGGNVSRAAELAGVSRRHITALMTKHGIDRARGR